MKYHYFHGRFTYSVKRSGLLAFGGFCSSKVGRLDSCVEACAVCFDCGGRAAFEGGLSGPSMVVARSTATRNRAYSVTRSGLKTVPDGEFDWGGTSVKR